MVCSKNGISGHQSLLALKAQNERNGLERDHNCWLADYPMGGNKKNL